ncbi:helix-turn-helix transcriptional regulator [Amycolatopsis antarctica]|uniref:Helix-turn-helix transcriptional regulator n=1 Tax=Amycolatopsis antarctica TaxID=1854586 RepID=A0A263D223_9PSEU|nr:LuxR C-terminal-related transcriptional regulator [Amycolatopsis antarctica]OZM72128.1 helix-turn-helix transcriptional regulator [Amycolatopsis antarctica]
MDKTKVAVYAADPLTHAGISRLLRSTPGLELVTGEAAVDATVTVVVLEEVGEGQAAARAVLRQVARQVSSPVVLITPHEGKFDTDGLAGLPLGAVVYREAATETRLLAAVREAGRATSAPAVETVSAAPAHPIRSSPNKPPSPFSEREKAVLRLLADGLDTAAVAKRLMFSERTVKYIVHALTLRLKLRNRSHAVAYALRSGAI